MNNNTYKNISGLLFPRAAVPLRAGVLYQSPSELEGPADPVCSSDVVAGICWSHLSSLRVTAQFLLFPLPDVAIIGDNHSYHFSLSSFPTTTPPPVSWSSAGPQLGASSPSLEAWHTLTLEFPVQTWYRRSCMFPKSRTSRIAQQTASKGLRIKLCVFVFQTENCTWESFDYTVWVMI